MDADILPFLLIGVVAQLVDGALGMAYGVISMSMLLSLGIPPAAASASVHMAEVVTTGISGASHLYYRNVDRFLLWRLALPGMVGAALGAYVLTAAPPESIKFFIAAYLAVMALFILRKAIAPLAQRQTVRHVRTLGFVGAFLDASGGGGWGPIVAATLIARGLVPRSVIGSVNLAEFFVTSAASATFVVGIGLEYGHVVIGLLLGGAIAAPFGGYLARKLPARVLMIAVAVIVLGLSARAMWNVLA